MSEGPIVGGDGIVFGGATFHGKRRFARGGRIPAGGVPVVLAPAEQILTPERARQLGLNVEAAQMESGQLQVVPWMENPTPRVVVEFDGPVADSELKRQQGIVGRLMRSIRLLTDPAFRLQTFNEEIREELDHGRD